MYTYYPELTYLRVKIASLMAEAKIIRRAERQTLSIETKRLVRQAVKQGVSRDDIQAAMDRTSFDIETGHNAGAQALRAIRRSIRPKRNTLSTYLGLTNHRKGTVRAEARAAQLAYAYLRGKRYAKTEALPYGRANGELQAHEKAFPTHRVAELVLRFGNPLQVKPSGDAVLNTCRAIERWYEGCCTN